MMSNLKTAFDNADIFNLLNEIVYIVDIHTHDLLFMNNALRQALHVAATNTDKCYAVLQKRAAPCPFCSIPKVRPGKTFEWTFFNPAVNQEYQLKSTLISYQGHDAMLEIAFDITEVQQSTAAKELAMELLEKQEEIDTLLAAVPGGIFQYEATKEGTFRFVSEQMLQILGYTAEEFKVKFNNSFTEMVYYKDREKVLQSITDQIKIGSFDTCEYRIETKNGTLKWFYDVGHLVQDIDGKKWFYVVIVDIDDRKRLEAEQANKIRLESALAAAQEANRAKSLFLSNVSHDMRTPLNGVIGYTDLALASEHKEQLHDYLHKIKYSSQLLLQLIKDTLDLSKIESGSYVLTPSPVSHEEIIRQIATTIQPAATAKGITLLIDESKSGKDAVNVDLQRLLEILLNLLNNAIKFTAPGGKVELSVERLGVTDNIIHTKFVVRDNGRGISPKFIPHMFEPFSQERNWEASNVPGTGLGLPIVKKLLDLMHGQIEVHSKLGQGSEFIVYLDLERVQIPSDQSKELQINYAILRGKRLLLCEDHPLNAEIAIRMLERGGMLVTLARNGQEGVNRFSQAPDHAYAAILMDVRMPVLDGLTATRKLRALSKAEAKTIPIIGMSANAYQSDIDEAKAAGMNDYVTKPISTVSLFSTLVKWLK